MFTRVHAILLVLITRVDNFTFDQYYELQDCQTYPDTLVFGLDYPDALETEVHSCADTSRLKDHLERVLNTNINKTIASGYKYRDTILLLSPRSTLPFLPDELPEHRFPKSGRTMNNTMHIIKSTIIRNAIWKQNSEDFHKFSEIIYEDDEQIECPNDDDFETVIRIFDGKHIYNKEFNTEDPTDLKVIIIPILKHMPMCLRVGLVNDKKIDDLGTLSNAYKNHFKTPANVAFNPYLTVSTLYQTSIEAVYPNFDRILNMETSTAPWVDEELLARNSTWCRSHRHILAFTDLVFEFVEHGRKVPMVATGGYYCSLQVLGDRRLIYMPFPAFGFSIVVDIKKLTDHDWFLANVFMRRTSDKKEFSIKYNNKKLTRYQTRYSEADKFETWNKEAVASCSRPHVGYGMFAVEFSDYGVRYNFSNKVSEMKNILGFDVKMPKI